MLHAVMASQTPFTLREKSNFTAVNFGKVAPPVISKSGALDHRVRGETKTFM
jgi:hypothetical protein